VGGACPLGGLVHRAGAAQGNPGPEAIGGSQRAGRPTGVLPPLSQYRQYRHNRDDSILSINPDLLVAGTIDGWHLTD